MRRWMRLAAVDGKRLLRDPMLALTAIGPLLVIALLYVAAPVVITQFPAARAFELPLAVVALLLVPLLPGTTAGFLLLDERDEGLIPVLSVTPLSKTGYFGYRMALPAALSTAYACLLLALAPAPFDAASAAGRLAAAAMAALQAPLYALALGAFAANKLEGLAMSKLSGWLVLAPLLLFAPEPYQWAAAALPTYWTAKAYEAAVAGAIAPQLLWGIGGVALHTSLFVVLLRKFLRRVE